jgi:hypothetical protein
LLVSPRNASEFSPAPTLGFTKTPFQGKKTLSEKSDSSSDINMPSHFQAQQRLSNNSSNSMMSTI